MYILTKKHVVPRVIEAEGIPRNCKYVMRHMLPKELGTLPAPKLLHEYEQLSQVKMAVNMCKCSVPPNAVGAGLV